MAKKTQNKYISRVIGSLGILLVLASSTPVGETGAWIMKLIGAVAVVVLLVTLCKMPDEDERR